ncbi:MULTISPECIES: RagB/SusD family nutrient uptake outer membrane protein [Sphingobacterium]|uniref:RagB/SusD family nutrient uptake outer membrane protein n=1 Tax=Sphingobacterium TaxID=28453 RepID=UPI0013DBEB97|nr:MULTISPECIES: RagB/SusD family nutrient uptake outer membrane protein [unclassified Sphingobacterium]
MRRLFLKNILFILLLAVIGCGNQFLDIKPSKNQRVPTSIEDYQAILDNPNNNGMPMNVLSSSYLGIVGSGEYHIEDAYYNAIPTGATYSYQKNAYVWAKDVYLGGEGGTTNPTDYDMAYQRILYCNIVLDGVERIAKGEHDAVALAQLKGDALFRRSLDFYNLAQLYCEVYDESRKNLAYGIPLRLSSSLDEHKGRGTLAQTYDRIVSDLSEALALLPNLPVNVFRPSKIAVYTLLSRVYMQKGNYDMALQVLVEALKIKADLIDFNSLSVGNNYRFPLYGIGNKEVIFTNATNYNVGVDESRVTVNAQLLGLYAEDDLRKKVYFFKDNKNKTLFYGSYYGNRNLFTGLATDELYLSISECLVRSDRTEEALDWLNRLLRKRMVNKNFEPVLIKDKNLLLKFVLEERQKELLLRGIRWEDMRRLNKESEILTTLRRVVNGKEFVLAPRGKNWVWPLPLEAVQLGGLEQNERE